MEVGFLFRILEILVTFFNVNYFYNFKTLQLSFKYHKQKY